MIGSTKVSAFGIQWDSIISKLPRAHILQTTEWAQVKERLGWEPFYLVWVEANGKIELFINQIPTGHPIQAAALVLQRSLRLAGIKTSLRILYSPKGPLLNWENKAIQTRVLEDLQTFTYSKGAIFLKIDPDINSGTGYPSRADYLPNKNGLEIEKTFQVIGWQYSNDQIQFKHTVLIDLVESEEELLIRMKQKTRYNIRLASRKGVRVRQGSPADYPLLYRMYAKTALRDRFIIRDEAYYLHVWRTFTTDGLATSTQPCVRPLIAEVDGEPVAALLLFIFAGKAWYLYGMSRDQHREKMPNYLLQWEAIRLVKALGCTVYDLWGAPDEYAETDPMWGVYRFKEGLGGITTRYIGAWDYPARPMMYNLYTKTLPRLLAIMRRRGQERIRSNAG